MTNHVEDHQRRRIYKATIEVAAQLGLDNISVQQIITRAGVSRVTFYKLFDNKHDAFHVAINAVVRELRGRVSGQPDPLTVLAAFACARAADTRCLLVELPGTAPDSYEDYLEGAIDDVVQTTGLDPTIAHLLVGGVVGILRNAVSSGATVDFAELEAFVRPYLDDAAIAA